MNHILEVLIKDFINKKPSVEYQLEQHNFSEVEKPFIDSLTTEQKKAYLNLNTEEGKLRSTEFDDFAKFLFENLKKFFN